MKTSGLISLFLFSISVIASFSFVYVDVEEQKAERKNYCELVSMWEEDAELGIEPVKRNGMPNYKEIDCEL